MLASPRLRTLWPKLGDAAYLEKDIISPLTRPPWVFIFLFPCFVLTQREASPLCTLSPFGGWLAPRRDPAPRLAAATPSLP